MVATPHRPPTTPARARGTPSAKIRGTPCRATPARVRGTTPRHSPTRPINSNSQGEEGIQVAIRMRPLNNNESSTSSVWKVLPKYHSVAQTTTEGKPLPERIMGRNFFSYDKTFGEEHDTKLVYDSIAKNIVGSVCAGLNGTIFAYGQTSSGKTYTMQGSGTIAEGQTAGSGGIVHMAAQDIFQHIKSQPDRVFLVRASFLEIYNEEVRDLLNGNRTLQVREDPRRGVFVQSQEEIVKDFEGLLEILFEGEKSRAFASTAMNERSSRSHTIFRITIESRSKDNDDSNDDDSQDGAVRVSTLNLVDLAGSESVRHTGATGDRQKEGGMINQSLLTLSRVIVALGTPNQAHINFRDSKLTRILQPSLSGNARMAVICCATPSQLYLEETRSTLLFASRAKLVKTNAQVNEVLDDRSIIRRLQRELALARRQVGGVGQTEHLKALEQRATQAGTEAKEANEKLKRLYNSLLNNTGGLFGGPETKPADRPVKRRRRFSEGDEAKQDEVKTPYRTNTDSVAPKTMPRQNVLQQLSPNTELSFLRQALSSKSAAMEKVFQQVDNASRLLQTKESELVTAMCTNELVKEDRDKATSRAKEFAEQLESMRSELEATKIEYESVFEAKERELSDALSRLEKELGDRKILEGTVDSLQDEKSQLSNQLATIERSNKDEVESLHESLAQVRAELEQATKVNSELQATIDQHVTEKADIQRLHDDALQQIETLQHDHETKTTRLTQSIRELEATSVSLTNQISSKDRLLDECHQELNSLGEHAKLVEKKLVSVREALAKREDENSSMEQQLFDMEARADGLTKQLEVDKSVYDATVHDLQQQLDALRIDRDEAINQLDEKTNSFQHNLDEKTTAIKDLTEKTERLSEELSQVSEDNVTAQSEITKLQSQVHLIGKDLEGSEESRSILEASLEKLKLAALLSEQELDETRTCLASKEATISDLEQQLSTTREEGESAVVRLEEEKAALEHELDTKTTSINELTDQVEALSAERDETRAKLESSLEVCSNLESEVEILKTSSLLSSNASIELGMSLEAAKSEVSRLEHELSETMIQVDTLREQIDTLTSQSSSSVKRLEEDKAALQKEIAEQNSDIDFLQEEIEGLSKELARSTETIVKLESEAATATSTADSSKVSLGILQQSLDDAQFESQRLQHELEQARESLYEKDGAINSLQEQLVAHEEQTDSTSQELMSEKNRLHQELDAKRTEADQLSEKVEKLSEELVLAQASKELAGEEITKLENQLESAQTSGDRATATLTETKAELLRVEQELAKTKAIYEQKLVCVVNKMTLLEDGISDAQIKIAGLTVALSRAEDTVSGLSVEKQATAEELFSLRKSTEESSSLEKQQHDLMIEELEQNLTRLQNELNEAIEQRDTLLLRVQEMDGQLQNAPSALIAEIGALGFNPETAVQEIASLISTRNLLQEKIDSSKREFDQQKESLAAELKEKVDELKREKDELLTIHDQLEQTNDRLNSVKLQLNDASDENEELKRLLMESNRSVEASRESEQTALRDLATRNEELEFYKEQLRALENKVEGGSDTNGRKQLIDSMQLAKQQLEQEVKSLKAREEAHKLHWETERRELIHDAEQEIQNLRAAAATAEEKSQRLEAEAYAAREMKESLEDKLKSDMDRTIQLESRLSSLENENTRLRRAASRQDTERQSNRANLQQIMTERDAAQNSLKQLENELELCQSKHTEAKQLLNDNVERLQEKVALCDSLEAKNELLSVEAESLRRQNIELEEKIREQEKRIKKMEKRALNSDQVKQLKQMKDDLAKKTKQLEELKSRPSHGQIELSTFDASSTQEDELAKLRFDSEALDTQRRKLSKQCQLLQEEKLKVIKILRSSKLLHGNEDIPTAMVTLVDKISSLEEEYSSRTKALQHQNRTMEDKISEEQKKSESLRKTLEHQRNLLSSFENTKAEERSASQYMESENRTLKEENLRLGQELKATKKKLIDKKAELEMQRSIQPVDESYLPAYHKSSVTKRIASSTKRVPSSTKRDRTPLSTSKENNTNHNEHPTPKRRRGEDEKRSERRAVGLGEAFNACEENTQECAQS